MRQWVSQSPGEASALVTAPRQPSLAEANPAALPWRDLMIDPDLGGIAPRRPRPRSIEISAFGTTWALPVPDVLGFVWHPELPLVAGLTVREGRAHPWVADYRDRTVVVHQHVRAVTSMAAVPLAFAGDELALLTPVAAAPREPLSHVPATYEAVGPGFITFEPGQDVLEELAAAHVSTVDLNGTVTVLTGPLLVRELTARDGAVEIEHATSGMRWARSLVAAPGSLLPVAPREVTVPEQRASGDALTVLGTGTETLLWMRIGMTPGTPAEPHLRELADTHGVAVLDLALDWPADADLADLHRQIVEPVRAALERLDGPVVIGGHSFGATVALYALAHLPELRAAIAHSGCYNRTLTPTGFQYERRSYWAVPELYHAFSALHFADRLDRPVLVVHGTKDLNPSTTPDQAVDFYRAVVANGGHARLVLLPQEGHTFQYRETTESVVAEHGAWLDLAGAS